MCFPFPIKCFLCSLCHLINVIVTVNFVSVIDDVLEAHECKIIQAHPQKKQNLNHSILYLLATFISLSFLLRYLKHINDIESTKYFS